MKGRAAKGGLHVTILHWLCHVRLLTHWLASLEQTGSLKTSSVSVHSCVSATSHMGLCGVTKFVDPQGLQRHRTFTGTCRRTSSTAWSFERRSPSQATLTAANLASRPFKGSNQNQRGSSFNELRPQTTGPRPRSSEGTSGCDPSATVTFDSKLPLWRREGGPDLGLSLRRAERAKKLSR